MDAGSEGVSWRATNSSTGAFAAHQHPSCYLHKSCPSWRTLNSHTLQTCDWVTLLLPDTNLCGEICIFLLLLPLEGQINSSAQRYHLSFHMNCSSGATSANVRLWSDEDAANWWWCCKVVWLFSLIFLRHFIREKWQGTSSLYQHAPSWVSNQRAHDYNAFCISVWQPLASHWHQPAGAASGRNGELLF